MDVHQAAEILLKSVYEDMNGRISFSDFLAHQTQGYNQATSLEIQGIYNKALFVLIDAGLCHRGTNPDMIELGQKGLEHKGNYKKYLSKKNTAGFLDKARRIAPILSFVFVALGFYFTYLKKQSNERKAKAKITQSRKDSILHSKANKGRH